VVTLAKLRRGVTRLRDGVRRRLLEQWLGHEVIARFASRIIPVDDAIAHCWGRIIAATAEHHDLTLVTRNSSDFDPR